MEGRRQTRVGGSGGEMEKTKVKRLSNGRAKTKSQSGWWAWWGRRAGVEW